MRKRIPAQLRRRQQIAACAIRLGRVGAEVLHRTFPDRLYPPELAVLTDAAAHRRPRPFDTGEVRRLVKYAVVHAPGERVTEERGRAHLRRVGILSVEEAGRPRPVRALDRPHLRAHLLEQFREPPPLRAVRGKLADDERKSGKDPSVPASPEELLATGSRPPHIPRVTPEEMFLAVIEVVVGGTVLAHHEIEVFPLARDRRELRPHGRGHEERVAPVPAPPVQDDALAFAAGERRIDVRRHERVEFRAHGRHDRIIALRARDVEPGLSDAVRVAHVGVALLELPAVRAPLLADGVDVPAFARRERELRQPGVERAIAPVAVVGALRMRQHPVRHLHAVGRNRRGVERDVRGVGLRDLQNSTRVRRDFHDKDAPLGDVLKLGGSAGEENALWLRHARHHHLGRRLRPNRHAAAKHAILRRERLHLARRVHKRRGAAVRARERAQRIERHLHVFAEVLLQRSRIDRNRVAYLMFKVPGVGQEPHEARFVRRVVLPRAGDRDARRNVAPELSRLDIGFNPRQVPQRGRIDESAPLHGPPNPVRRHPARRAHHRARRVHSHRLHTFAEVERRRHDVHHRKSAVRPVPRLAEIGGIGFQEIGERVDPHKVRRGHDVRRVERHLPRLRATRHGAVVECRRLVDDCERLCNLRFVAAPRGRGEESVKRHRRVAVAVVRTERRAEVGLAGLRFPDALRAGERDVAALEIRVLARKERRNVARNKHRRGTPHVRDTRKAHVALRHGGKDLGGDRTQTRGQFLVARRLAVERGRKMLHEDGRVRDERRLETPADGVLELHALADG